MSAVTDQTNCESLMIAALALQADLIALNAAGGIVHGDKAAQTSATNLNRIIVEASNRETKAAGKDQSSTVIWGVKVKVTVRLVANDPALMDTYFAAVEAANVGSCPASIVTLATSLFGSRGFNWYDTEEGERTNEPNERIRSKTWEARFGA